MLRETRERHPLAKKYSVTLSGIIFEQTHDGRTG